MKLLANENFPLTSGLFLREKGHDIILTGSDFSGVTDTEVISLANEQGRTILTFDSDYGELIFKNGLKAEKGVIYLRIKEFSPVEPGQIVHELLSSSAFNTDNTLTVLDRDGIRQRSY